MSISRIAVRTFFEITIFRASEKPDPAKILKTINDYRYDNFNDRYEFQYSLEHVKMHLNDENSTYVAKMSNSKFLKIWKIAIF